MAAIPIPVRLTKVQIERLDAVAKKLGTNRTAVIKMCLLAFLQRFEKDGLAMLPPDWDDQLKAMDGRTHRYTGGTVPQITGENVAINNTGTLTQKKKSTYTSAAPEDVPGEAPPPPNRKRKKK